RADGFVGDDMFVGLESADDDRGALGEVVSDGDGVAGDFREHLVDVAVGERNVAGGVDGFKCRGIFFTRGDDLNIGMLFRGGVEAKNVTVTKSGEGEAHGRMVDEIRQGGKGAQRVALRLLFGGSGESFYDDRVVLAAETEGVTDGDIDL